MKPPSPLRNGDRLVIERYNGADRASAYIPLRGSMADRVAIVARLVPLVSRPATWFVQSPPPKRRK